MTITTIGESGEATLEPAGSRCDWCGDEALFRVEVLNASRGNLAGTYIYSCDRHLHHAERLAGRREGE